jgi:hypothetical protein
LLVPTRARAVPMRARAMHSWQRELPRKVHGSVRRSDGVAELVLAFQIIMCSTVRCRGRECVRITAVAGANALHQHGHASDIAQASRWTKCNTSVDSPATQTFCNACPRRQHVCSTHPRVYLLRRHIPQRPIVNNARSTLQVATCSCKPAIISPLPIAPTYKA